VLASLLGMLLGLMSQKSERYLVVVTGFVPAIVQQQQRQRTHSLNPPAGEDSRTRAAADSRSSSSWTTTSLGASAQSAASFKGFGGGGSAVAEKEPPAAVTSEETKTGSDNDDKTEYDFSHLPSAELKSRLLDLVPRMTGTNRDEIRTVEGLVNALEQKYEPVQTLQFLNLVLQGEWQLIFSTNLSSSSNPAKFRLRELTQTIKCDGLEGRVSNLATWDLAQQTDLIFDATGTFEVQCSYQINQGGARMVLELQDHVLKPARGSAVPADVPKLVGTLHRAMPKELFDPSEHAVDTTYVDADVRIARYTGPRLEGVRDIFIRKGSIEIDPTPASASADAASAATKGTAAATEDEKGDAGER